MAVVMLLWILLPMAGECAAKEVLVNPKDLKKEAAAPVAEKPVVETTPSVTATPGLSPSGASPSVEQTPPQATPSAEPTKGIDEWEGIQSNEEGWKPDPNRGRPKINFPLMFGSLIVVCILAFFGLKFYFSLPGAGGGATRTKGKLMNIREKQMVAPGKQICIVELPGKIVLLGITDSEMRVLTEIDPEKIPSQEEEESGGPVENSASSYLLDVFHRWTPQGK